MRIKTNELVGNALAWAVATCEGRQMHFDDSGEGPWFSDAETHRDGFNTDYGSWEQCGPIIDREHIELRPGSYIGSKENPRMWAAWCQNRHGDRHQIGNTGPTAVIAAMRAYVAGKLGNVIEIPGELCAKP